LGNQNQLSGRGPAKWPKFSVDDLAVADIAAEPQN